MSALSQNSCRVAQRFVSASLLTIFLGLAGRAEGQFDLPGRAEQTEPAPLDQVATEVVPPAEPASATFVQSATAAAEPAKVPENVAGARLLHPSPTSPRRPAFQLYAAFDVPIMGVGLVFAGARLIRTQTAYCAPLCRSNTLNPLDEITAGYWSPGWQTASNVGLYALMGGAAALLVLDEGWENGLHDAVVITESALAATALASILTLAVSRPRPFEYGDKAPLSQRNKADAGMSFLSSHASVAFGIAVSSYMASRRLHPQSKTPLIVLGVGGALASFVGIARLLGGMHFITDVVGGAVVGTSMGVLVPALHSLPVTLVPMAGGSQRGLALAGRF